MRRDKRLGADGTDVLIQGLRELCDMLNRQVAELQLENAALKRAAAVRDRRDANRKAN